MHYCICDFIADIVQNAVEADSRFTHVDVLQDERNLRVTVRDTGKGMTQEQLNKAKDPFMTDGIKHPGRKIGLGIPFLLQSVEETGGDFDIQSQSGKGTTLSFRFDLKNLDTPPLGSLTDTFLQILSFPGDYELEIHRTVQNKSYQVARSELLETLEELESAGSLNLLKQYLDSLEESVLSEQGD